MAESVDLQGMKQVKVSRSPAVSRIDELKFSLCPNKYWNNRPWKQLHYETTISSYLTTKSQQQEEKSLFANTEIKGKINQDQICCL